jgi:glycosyltransferase involved in cell wall biosynthesis
MVDNNLEKIKVFHFHNGTGGGVLSVIENLLKYSTNEGVENHVIFTINKDLLAKYEMPKLEGAVTQQLFYYSAKWNFYHTCRQLAKLLPDDKSVVAAHDWLELGMSSQLGLRNPVVHFLHGDFDYYYDLAKKHGPSIDQFIVISPVIYHKLCSTMPDRKTDIHYCRFPVPAAHPIRKENKILRIIYCVRSLAEERKQFKILPLINKKLAAKNLKIEWTIIGGGMEKREVENVMHQQTGISFFPVLPNEEVINLLPQQDLFILPSLSEGFPVAVVEAMKAGLVPLVTNWDGATDELIINNETGYYFSPYDVDKYAATISLLSNDRKLLYQLAENAIEKANELFDPFENTNDIEEVIVQAYSSDKKIKKPFKIYGSRLDKEWIPNFITRSLRN